MQITHVLRGEEWLNSAPKHILLYQYFGWDMPVLCHLPLLRNPDKSKLSKRKNPTSILYYQRMGFFPEALVNYLGRMGWSMPDEREKFSLDEMQAAFDIQRVSLGGPIFDVEKLNWLNGLWLRESIGDDELVGRFAEWALNRDGLLALLPLIKPRMEVMSDIVPMAGFLVSGQLSIAEDNFSVLTLEIEDQKKILQFSLWRLEQLSEWNRDLLFEELKALAAALDFKLKEYLAPLFVAITGSTDSFSVMDAMALLGSDMSRARLRHAIDTLGGVSKKQLKRYEKEFALI